MPLSEHEQRVLDEIESALYAEDPKFASSSRMRGPRGESGKLGVQVACLFALGLVMLILGVVLPIKFPGSFPILSLVGFLVMFLSGVRWLWSTGGSPSGGKVPTRRGNAHSRTARSVRKPSLSERMENRFRQRFEDNS